eukprot:TRINITY_DN1056_c0_g1_i1.p1 TRINITY_DN1056_c0_g1~~TRINITY_DN1056_c0_g1_i1.p1  ORF type:complete len:505 (-),score=140.06 TRINITY_DN1056_c0_g1_i1:236-1750(-)
MSETTISSLVGLQQSLTKDFQSFAHNSNIFDKTLKSSRNRYVKNVVEYNKSLELSKKQKKISVDSPGFDPLTVTDRNFKKYLNTHVKKSLDEVMTLSKKERRIREPEPVYHNFSVNPSVIEYNDDGDLTEIPVFSFNEPFCQKKELNYVPFSSARRMSLISPVKEHYRKGYDVGKGLELFKESLRNINRHTHVKLREFMLVLAVLQSIRKDGAVILDHQRIEDPQQRNKLKEVEARLDILAKKAFKFEETSKERDKPIVRTAKRALKSSKELLANLSTNKEFSDLSKDTDLEYFSPQKFSVKIKKETIIPKVPDISMETSRFSATKAKNTKTPAKRNTNAFSFGEIGLVSAPAKNRRSSVENEDFSITNNLPLKPIKTPRSSRRLGNQSARNTQRSVSMSNLLDSTDFNLSSRNIMTPLPPNDVEIPNDDYFVSKTPRGSKNSSRVSSSRLSSTRKFDHDHSRSYSDNLSTPNSMNSKKKRLSIKRGDIFSARKKQLSHSEQIF